MLLSILGVIAYWDSSSQLIRTVCMKISFLLLPHSSQYCSLGEDNVSKGSRRQQGFAWTTLRRTMRRLTACRLKQEKQNRRKPSLSNWESQNLLWSILTSLFIFSKRESIPSFNQPTMITPSIRPVLTKSLFSVRSTRAFSSCEPAQKLKAVFEDYRREQWVTLLLFCSFIHSCASSFLISWYCSYSRETPHRFKRELVKAANPNYSGSIKVDTLNQILVNIGKAEERLSEEELKVLMTEANGSMANREISMEKVIQLM